MKFIVDHVAKFPYDQQNPAKLRELTLSAIENQGFHWWIVFVAGIGFFVDAYTLFASNFVNPILAWIYWHDDYDNKHETAINCATLAGTLVGQLTFGILADKLGRRKMYGVELIILIMATLGFAMSSSGKDGSMQIQGWLVFWRFWTGLGAGADYPLSAALTAEFASTLRRGRMLAVVFAMQPLGQLTAALVSLAVVYGYRARHPSIDPSTADSMWRLIVGVGTVPAVIALLFRLTICESPRFTLDKLNNPAKAVQDLAYYRGESLTELIEANERLNPGVTAAAQPSQQDGRPHDVSHTPNLSEVSNPEASAGASDTVFPLTDSGAEEFPVLTESAIADTHFVEASWSDFKGYFLTQGNWTRLAGTTLCWMTLDFAFYGLGIGSTRAISKIFLDHADDTRRYVWDSSSDSETSFYSILIQNATNFMIIVSIGACFGSAVLVLAIDKFHRRNIQFWGFVALTLLFIIVGSTFASTVQTTFHGVTITLYVLCQIAFNFGPNSLTYIIAAEIFPTRYRCTCLGVSAAAGKLGSVIVQVFLSYVHFEGLSWNDPRASWLGYVLLVFSAFMAFGAALTWATIPKIQSYHPEKPHLRNIDIDELGKGREYETNRRKDDLTSKEKWPGFLTTRFRKRSSRRGTALDV